MTDSISSLLNIIHAGERLEALPRTGWITCGVQNPESIAAHSYMVTIIAMWIADHLDEPVNVERLLRMALLHDFGESMLTDLPWPVKQFVGPDALQQAETRATEHLLTDAPTAWQEAYDDAIAKQSLEARILKAADRIQMLAKSLQYRQQHRGHVERFWQNSKHRHDYGIPLVRQIFDALKAHHDAGTWIEDP